MTATFWAGDSLGLFGLAPLFLMATGWLRRRFDPPPGAGRQPRVYGSAIGGTVLAEIAFLVLVILLASRSWNLLPSPPLYLLSLPVLWIAYRHGIGGAAPAVAAANAGPLLALALDSGMAVDLAALQVQLVAGSIAGIALGAAVTEGRRRGAQLVQMQAEREVAHRLADTNAALLTVILGNAEALSAALAGDRKLQALADLTCRAAERGAALTARLLAFARQQALQPASVDVNAVLRDMESLLERALGEGIVVQFALEPALRQAQVDAAQLEAAVLNICINARDAMPAGGRLRIETANARLDGFTAEGGDRVAPGWYVTLSVTDTGAGMTPEVLARAFDPFFTTKEAGRGSGLGLSMVYGFAIQSGGHARIRSALGQGSIVALYLPEVAAEGVGMEVPRKDAAVADEAKALLPVR